MADGTTSTDQDLPTSEGGSMHFGGTDAAYDGMEDKNIGDNADMANEVDRTDMDGLDEDPPRPNMDTPPEMIPPPTAPGDNSTM